MSLSKIIEILKNWTEIKFLLIVSCISLFIHSTFLTHLISMMTVVQLHELGHAIVANLGGILAIPIGVMGFTMWFSYERLYFFVFLFLCVQVFLIYKFYKLERSFLFIVGICILVINIKLVFFLPLIKLHQYISAAGLAGEIFLPMVGLSLFFFKIEDIPRWDFWKYVIAGYMTIAYVATLKMWYRIVTHQQPLPFGSALSVDGASDTNGDLNKLVAAGWTESSIQHFYVNSIKFSVVIILSSAIYQLWISFNEKSSELENSEL